MSWQTITPQSHLRSTEPKLHVYTNLNGRLNAAADKEWFEAHDAVQIKADPDGERLGLAPDGEYEELENYAIGRDGDDNRGGEVAIKTALKSIGVTEDDVTEMQKLPLEEEDGVIVADVSPILDDSDSDIEEVLDEVNEPVEEVVEDLEYNDQEDANGASVDSSDEETVDDEPAEEDVDPRAAIEGWAVGTVAGGRTYQLESREIAEQIPGVSSRQVGQHLGQLRDDDAFSDVHIEREDRDDWDRARWRVAHPDRTGSDDEEEDTLREELVEAAEDVETLSEFADVIDAPSVDRARTIAMNADVYSRLDDNPEAYGRTGGA